MPCHGMQSASVREKEMKRQTLLELVDYVNTGTGKFTELVSEVCAGAVQKLYSCTMRRAESICQAPWEWPSALARPLTQGFAKP